MALRFCWDAPWEWLAKLVVGHKPVVELFFFMWEYLNSRKERKRKAKHMCIDKYVIDSWGLESNSEGETIGVDEYKVVASGEHSTRMALKPNKAALGVWQNRMEGRL